MSNVQAPNSGHRRLVLAAALLCCAANSWAVVAGQVAPDVDLPSSTVAAKLSELKGKFVYVDFWASWCGPCKLSYPWMAAMQRQYAARGLQVLAINVDAKRADADKFLASHAAANLPTLGLAFDARGESAKQFGLKVMPTSYLVGRDGKVIFVHTGFRLEDRAELEAKLAAALAAP